MSRMQPHSFVGGSNYDLIGNVAGPTHQNVAPTNLSGIGTYFAGIGTLTAAAFIYGVVKKKPSELNLGYAGASFLATLPVATDAWLNNGERYGNLTTKGLIGTYASLAAPPLIAIFAGSQIGNYVAGQRPQPRSRKKAWYEGRFARSEPDKWEQDKKNKRKSEKKERQDRQNKRSRKGRGKKKRGKREIRYD